MYTENNTQSQDIVCKVPVTEEEAFKILDEIFPLEEKRMAIEGTKDEFTANEHFELGMWIRNHWLYPPEDANNDTVERYMKCYAMLTGTQPGDPVFEHPDSISGDFLGRYYNHLKNPFTSTIRQYRSVASPSNALTVEPKSSASSTAIPATK